MRRREFALFVAPSMLVMGALLVVPLVTTVVWSFQDVGYGAPGRWIGFDNFTETLATPRFLDSAGFTVGFTVVVMALKVLLGYLVALGLHVVSRGRSIFLGLLLVAYIVPTVVGALVFSWLFNDTFGGLVNWVLSIVGVHVNWLVSEWPARALLVMHAVWHELAFPVLILLAGLQTMPTEPLEAADIDGANWLQKQRYVVLPALSRLFSFIALISIMDGFRVFDSIRMITPASQTVGTESVMSYIYDVALGEGQRLGLGSAISLLTVLATFVVLIPFIRQTYRDVRVR